MSTTTQLLWDALYLLQQVEGSLELAAQSWTSGMENRLEAAEAFDRVVQLLAQADVELDDQLILRARDWADGRKSAAELRVERDEVIALLGVVRYLISQQDDPESVPRTHSGGSRWERARVGRQSVGTVRGAG